MSRPRKHHYLPQFYLRRFSTDGEGLYQVNKTNGRIAPVKIKDTGAIRDFHTLDGEDSDNPDALESALSQVEGALAPHLADFLSGGFHRREARLYVMQFVSMMRMRVPALRDYLQVSMADVVHTELALMESQGKLPPAPPGLEDLLRVENLRVEMLNHKVMEQMYALASNEEVLHILYSMRPTLLHAPMGTRFITSDQPVALYHPDAPRLMGIGPDTPDVMISLPLSSRSALLLTHDRFRGVERSARATEVEEINRRTALLAQKWIFTGEAPAQLIPLLETGSGQSYGFVYEKMTIDKGTGFLMQYRGVGPVTT